jgi:nicotinate-nucleotide adenylyltransferase
VVADRTPRRPERLGVLGGTFDPVHVGHVVAAVGARHALALDRVLLVVAGDPWQKEGQVVADAESRYAMVAAAVEGVSGLDASRVEIDRPGPTYTADTLRELEAPDRDLHLVVGSDVAASLHTWRRVDEVRERAVLVVVAREGEARVEPADAGWRVVHLAIPRLDVSSTDCRDRVASGRPIDGLVPPAAVRVVEERGLYTRLDGSRG